MPLKDDQGAEIDLPRESEKLNSNLSLWISEGILEIFNPFGYQSDIQVQKL